MNKAVFKKDDFVLCDIPVPKGYPQSQTHVGVAFYAGKCYLTTSPYPSPKYGLWYARWRKLLCGLSYGKLCSSISGEPYENPCIYIGEIKEGMAPARFKLMCQKPLMESPEEFYGLPSYNSDPDIFIEDGVIHVINRSVIRTKVFRDKPYEFVTRIYLIKGVDENRHFKMLSNQLVREGNDNFVSPSLIKFKDRYLVAYLDNFLANRKVLFSGLFVSSANSVEGAIKADDYVKINVNGGDMTPWHMSLFQYAGKLYTIITCVKNGDASLKMWQMLGCFNDTLTELTIFQTPLTDYNSYRSAACVREDGMFVLYNTTLREKVPGSKSIDGRDVIMVTCDFEELLRKMTK